MNYEGRKGITPENRYLRMLYGDVTKITILDSSRPNIEECINQYLEQGWTIISILPLGTGNNSIILFTLGLVKLEDPEGFKDFLLRLKAAGYGIPDNCNVD